MHTSQVHKTQTNSNSIKTIYTQTHTQTRNVVKVILKQNTKKVKSIFQIVKLAPHRGIPKLEQTGRQKNVVDV